MNLIKTIVPVSAIAVFAVFIFLIINAASSREQPANILITEVLSSNTAIAIDESGRYNDFIELYNAGSSTVNLQGWFLTDNSNNPMRWTVPAVTIEPGEYIFFYASGLDRQQENGIWHTNFSITADGTEPVILSSPDGTVHTHIEPFKTLANISYGLADDFETYVYMSIPTPGQQNSAPYFNAIQDIISQSKSVIISEYMTRNISFFPDENGRYHDWVELHNLGDETVSLKGWYLSDNPDRPGKWQFPDDAIIEPGGFLVLYCSGLKLPGHLPFRLSANDRALVLSDYSGHIIDTIAIAETPLYSSYGRKTGGTGEAAEGFFPIPTPGESNDSEPVPSIYDIAWEKPHILIMEYMSNNGYIIDSDGDFSDWAEIYNYGSVPVDLSDMFLSDKEDNLNKWGFPEGCVLGAGERMVIWLSGKNMIDSRDNAIHANFSISEADDGIILSTRNKQIVDFAAVTWMPPHVSAGRDEDDFDIWLFYPRPTPGAANTTKGFEQLAGLTAAEREEDGKFLSAEIHYSGFTMPVYTDTDELIVSKGTIISLRTGEPGATIRYTTDGSEPSESSPAYTGPITIESNTVIRACAFAPGKLPGMVLTRTYLVAPKHDIPVVTIAIAPYDFSSEAAGIYRNYTADLEAKVNFAFYEDNLLCVESDAGAKIQGHMSRGTSQKSLSIQFKEQYGVKQLAYPLIPGIDRTLYDAIVLRGDGLDLWNTKLTDSVIAMSVLDVTHVPAMGSRPVAVYINGRYWGLYNLREKLNADYFKINEGLDDKLIDMIKMNDKVTSGSVDEHNEMLEVFESMMQAGIMNTDEAYAYADANIDLDNWIDYWIVVTFFGNSDTSNIKFYKQQGEGHKWRWALYDQDYALRDHNSISNMLGLPGHGHSKRYSTVIARALMQNSVIKDRFVKRYAELLQTVLSAGRLLAIYDDYAAQIESEMPRQISRWRRPASMQTWRENMEISKNFLIIREKSIKRYLQNTLRLSNEDMNRYFPAS